jgi:CRP-like cAMP-binding protein
VSSPIVPDLSGNLVLANLPAEELDRLRPHLQCVEFNIRDVIWRPGDLITCMYFPIDAVISLLATMEDGKTVEVGLKGFEGVLGIDALLGLTVSANVAIIQGAGRCIRIRTDAVRTDFERCAVLHARLLQYVRYFMTQLKQTAACNRVHVLQQRVCRWLLMMHDRTRKDEFPMTHEFLSYMLGVSRTEVTLAGSYLRGAGLIRYKRSVIAIADRTKLEANSCECYRNEQAEFLRFVASLGAQTCDSLPAPKGR